MLKLENMDFDTLVLRKMLKNPYFEPLCADPMVLGSTEFGIFSSLHRVHLNIGLNAKSLLQWNRECVFYGQTLNCIEVHVRV